MKVWIYRGATALFCLIMTAGGVGDVLRLESMSAEILGLGYPAYLMTILGVAKLAGVGALVLPVPPVLKEWAYAGFSFDLLGAAVSHAVVGDPVFAIVKPLAVLAVAALSYATRPEAQRLPGLAPLQPEVS